MLELDGRSESRGNEIHHDSTDFVVNILLLIVDSLLLLVNPLLLLIDPLLQRSLAMVLDAAEMKIRFTNLILHHRITNALNHTPKLNRVLAIAEESLNPSLPLQWG